MSANEYIEIKQIIEHLREEVEKLLFETETLQGDTDAEKGQDLLEKLDIWEKQYVVKSEDFSVYGYITWYLDISFRECCCDEGSDKKTYLLKLLMISLYKLCSHKVTEKDIQYQLEYYFYETMEEVEKNHVYDVSYPEVMADLRHYYEHSYHRYLGWKQSYSNHPELIATLGEELKRNYEIYLALIEFLTHLEKDGFVKINHLGEKEGENTTYSELSMYFISSSEKTYLLVLSDFA